MKRLLVGLSRIIAACARNFIAMFRSKSVEAEVSAVGVESATPSFNRRSVFNIANPHFPRAANDGSVKFLAGTIAIE